MAFAVAALGTTAIQAQMVAIVLARGGEWDLATASLAVATGVKLPTRVAVRPFAARLGDGRVARGVFLLQAASLLLLASAADGPGWWAGVVAFGCADSLTTPVRAATLRGAGGSDGYGGRLGRAAIWTALGRAAGPVSVPLLAEVMGGYPGALVVLAAGAVVGVGLIPWRRSGAVAD